MFREEKFAAGVFWFRTTPDGTWHPDNNKSDRLNAEAPAMYEALGKMLAVFGSPIIDPQSEMEAAIREREIHAAKAEARAILERIDK